MSKRSYRRLAVVVGAALALGSMAPAMAVRVGGDAEAAVSADAIDVSSFLGGVQSTQLPTGLVLNTVGGIQQTALSTAFLTLNDVKSIAVGGVTCLAGAGTSAVLGLGAGVLADAGVNVGLGGLHVGLGLDALVGEPLLLAGDLTECLGDAKAGVLTAVGHAHNAVGTATQLATTTALGAVGTATSLPGAVVGTATSSLLGSLLDVTASGNAAALVSLF